MKEFLSREGDHHCSIHFTRLLDYFKSSEISSQNEQFEPSSMKEFLSEKSSPKRSLDFRRKKLILPPASLMRVVIHVHVLTCMYMFVRSCMYVHICVYVHEYIYIYTIYTCTYVYVYSSIYITQPRLQLEFHAHVLFVRRPTRARCKERNALQGATHCNTLQHTAIQYMNIYM